MLAVLIYIYIKDLVDDGVMGKMYWIIHIFHFLHKGNLRYFQQDPDCYDQFSVIYDGGERTAIFKNTAREPVVIEERAVCKIFEIKFVVLLGSKNFQEMCTSRCLFA